MKIVYGDVAKDGRGHWVIQMQRIYDEIPANGNPKIEEGVYVVPEDAFEWRAAEYGIDPLDINTLVDIILAEPFIEAAEDIPPLFTAESIAEARRIHLSRCSEAKLKHRISTRGDAHPLQELKGNVLMNIEAVKLKSEIVARQRRIIQDTRDDPADRENDRLNQLRRIVSDQQEKD